MVNETPQEKEDRVNMKAAILDKVNGQLVIDDVDKPTPRAGEILVKIAASGVCHTDLHVVTGSLQTPLPAVLGHEGAGIVEEVGEGLENLTVGDHVILYLPSCGKCYYCSIGKQTLCRQANDAIVSGTMPDGTSRLFNKKRGILHHFFAQSSFAEYAVVSKNGIAKIDPAIDLEVAALFGCGVRTGVGAVSKIARVGLGSTVAIFGCGGVGLSTLIAAKASGASQIIAIDIVEEKLKFAIQLGATTSINSRTADPVGKIREITGDGVDYSFEVVGNPKVMRQAFDALRPAGQLIIVGAAPVNSEVQLNPVALLLERSVIGTSSGGTYVPVDVPVYLDMYKKGILPIDKILTRRLTLDEINTGFELMLSGHPGRAIVKF